MERKFIGAGLLSGLIAGIIAFIYARIFIEPQVGKAIDYEEGRSHAEEMLSGEHGHEHEVFTRSVQENIGAGVGTVVFALCMGAFFAVAFTILWAYVGRRWPDADPKRVAAGLGALGFVSFVGVPFFVYPPNPPAVGEESTIGERSSSYLAITVVSLVAMILAVWLTMFLWDRFGGLLSGIVSGVVFLVIVTIAAALLPEFKEIPGPVVDGSGKIVYEGFPGQVVADFRVYAIANQVIIWTLLTVGFCLLIGLMTRRSNRATDDAELASV
ncbi:MAG: CbtA family protein [Gordonia sp. (in: high G+C Gram-positive bacteria)]